MRHMGERERAANQDEHGRARRRVGVMMGVGLASLGLLVFACTTDYQKGLEDPHYGLPNALAGTKQPGPTSNATDNQSGGTTTTPQCVKENGTLIDGGACTVSFKSDVLGAFATATCDRAGCHGGQTPPSEPRIDPKDAPNMWSEFAAFKLSNGKLYTNPCSTDPTKAAIASNVNGTAPVADRGALMPLGSTGLAPDVVTKIETWVKCGSPNN
jgi:hypothetical protein